MRVLTTIQHPAHVHLFRTCLRELEAQGHETRVVAREKDIAIKLLEEYDLSHKLLAGKANSISELAFSVQPRYEWGVFKEVRTFKPDVLMAMSEPSAAHASRLFPVKSLLFNDTEHALAERVLALPFADRICTPECYKLDHGNNHVRYAGYHELAYLHPNRFTPDPSVFDDLPFSPDDKIVIVRLNAWQAAHDIGDGGFDDIMDVIHRLEETGAKIIITSEPALPQAFQPYEFDIELSQMHSLMFYANLLIGESSTMASESAVLGTPAIFISTSSRGYTDELQDRYGLVFHYADENRQEKGIQKAVSILENYDASRWQSKRDRLLSDKVDTTSFMLAQIADLTGLVEPTPNNLSQ